MNTITRPDFSSLSAQELVDTYNRYVDKWRNSKFSSKADGISACNKAFDNFVKKGDYTVIEAPAADIPDEFEQAQEDYDRARQVEAEVIEELGAKSSGVAVPEKSEQEIHTSVNLRLLDEMSLADDVREKIKKLIEGKSTRTAPAGPRKTKNGDKIIKIKVLRNPRREGTQAWKHFQVMNRGDVKTVSDYLSHFENRKNASQWLSNTIADGFVELVDGE